MKLKYGVIFIFWFLVIIFLKNILIGTLTTLAILITYGIIKDFKRNKEKYEKENYFILIFNLKAPFLLSFYLILIGKLSVDFPEKFLYGDKIFHFIFNDTTFQIYYSTVTAFIFLFISLISDIRKNGNNIIETKRGLENIVREYLKKDEQDIEKINCIDILKKIDNKDINEINIKEKLNFDMITDEIKKIKRIAWITTTNLNLKFFIIEDSVSKKENSIESLKNILDCIVEIDGILRNPYKYIWGNI